MVDITDREFLLFRDFIHGVAGITLAESKKALISSRLSGRLAARKVGSFAEYHRLLTSGDDAAEAQIAVDLLTTNETYFFREGRHFELLEQFAKARTRREGPLRVWSAACSSGEEPYSIAMLLASLPELPGFTILASDLSTRVLETARRGLYPMSRINLIPEALKRRFCLRGQKEYEGMLLVAPALRTHVTFRQLNLNEPLPAVGQFDCIFLRNVMIYFNVETKRAVIERIAATLRPGGLLFIGLSESLNGVSNQLQVVEPAVYRKPAP